jgi:PAS domain S-box-containing protein
MAKGMAKFSRDTDDRFVAAFKPNPNALFLSTKEDGRILEVNEVFLSLFQCAREEVIGKTTLSIDMYTDPEIRNHIASKLRAEGHVSNFETRIKRKSGEERIVLLSVEWLQINDENAMLTIVQDISEQKKMEAELKRSMEEYQQLIESANSIILRYNMEGIITFANEYALHFFGYNHDELVGKEVTNLMPQKELSGRKLHFLVKDIFKTPGKYEHFENENIKKNGDYAWISWTNKAIAGEDGNIKEILTIGNDITNPKKTEDALKVEHNILEAVINNIGVGFVVSDPTGNVVSLNKAFSIIHDFHSEKEGLYHLRQYTKEFELEFSDGSVVPFEQWPLSLALNGEYVKDYILCLVRKKSNSKRIVSYNAIPVHNSNGTLTYIVLTITDLTDIEERTRSLAYERELFEGVFDNIPVMITIYDPKLNYFRFNKFHKKILGWSEADADHGKLMTKIFPEREYRIEAARFIQSLEPGWKEWYVKTKYGSFVDSEWANIMLNSGAQIGIGIDIRERKRAEERISENEKRLQGIFNNAAIGIVETDSRDRLVQVNNRICEILGYSNEELLGKSIPEITYPEDRLQTNKLNARLQEGDFSMFSYEKRYIKKDGGPLWVHVSVSSLTNSHGKHEKSIVTIEDISERKQAEERLYKALAEAEEGKNILLTLMENIPIGITIADAPNEKIRMISKYGLDMLDRTQHEVSNLSAFDQSAILGLYHTDGKTLAKPHEAPLSRVIINHEYIKNEEWLLKHNDGMLIPILCNASPILNKEGKLIGGVVAWQDITDQKKSEDEIRQKNEELTRFIYTVSHDLKSPLVTIKSFTEYLREDINSNDKQAQEKDLAYIGNAADKMSKLLEELLEISRIGRKENPKIEIPFEYIVNAALDLVAGSISKKNVEIRFNTIPVKLFGHSQRLIQLFQNLIDNAVKFMGNQPQPLIEIGAITDNPNEIIFYIKDNGSGIDPRYHHKIFGLFEKLNTHTEGTGIGLALVKRIIEFHGGKIWFESEGEGQGTSFYFTLDKSRLTK